MSIDVQGSLFSPTPVHDLCEKDAAATSPSGRPQRVPAGQVDGEVGGAQSGQPGARQGAGGGDPGRHAGTVPRQLRLGLICKRGSVAPARATGKEVGFNI